MGNQNNINLLKKSTKIIIVLIIMLVLFVCSGCGNPTESIPHLSFDLTVLSSTSVELSWRIYNYNVEEYTLTKANEDSLIATFFFSADENSFIDNQIIPGITYRYNMLVNGDDYFYGYESINTLEAPSSLSAIVFNGEAIKLNWQDNNQIEDHYYIERKEENEAAFTIIDSLPTNSTNYLDYNLEHMKRYTYRVNSKVDNNYTEYTNSDSTGFHYDGLFVPTDYLTIEQAFIAASPAEKVILEPGSYEGGIVFPTKSITLCSRFVLDNNPNYIENTIIDGQNQNIVGVKFPSISSYYHPQGRLKGLTIQHCNSGAIRCLDNTHPTFSNLIIKDNNAGSYGAIYFQNCTNTNISNLLIYNNSSSSCGSAINLRNASIRIYNCTITKNNNNPIYCLFDSRFGVYNSIVYNNIGNAIYMDESCWNCIIFYSDIEGGEDNILNLSSVETWWFNSINEDPFFMDAENYNFHLLPESPCVDAGQDLEIYLDVDGTRNDMGAYGGPNGDW